MKPHLNLLPQTVRYQLLLRRRTRDWALRWMLLACLVLVLFGGTLHQWTSAAQELELWKRRACAVEDIDRENRKLLSQTGLLQRRLDKYRHLQSERLGYQLLSTLSHSSRDAEGEMQIRKLAMRLVETQVAPKDKSASAEPVFTRSYVLSLTGMAKTHLHVAQFASSLRDSGAFERVDLKSARDNPAPGDNDLMYHLDCTF